MPSTNKIAIEFTEEQWYYILGEIEIGLSCYYIDDDNEGERMKIQPLEEIKAIIKNEISFCNKN